MMAIHECFHHFELWPLSGSVLIQAGTEDLPYGFQTQPADGRKRITDLGGYPPNVRKVSARVTLKNAAVATALVLDGNGYPAGREAAAQRADGTLNVTLPEDSLYTLVR